MRIRDELALIIVLFLVFYGVYRLGAFGRITWILCLLGFWVLLVFRMIWKTYVDDFKEIDIDKWEKENDRKGSNTD